MSSPRLNEDQLRDLPPRISKHVNATERLPSGSNSAPVLIGPLHVDRRRRVHAWLTLSLPIVVRGIIEATTVTVAMLVVPMDGVTPPFIVAVVLLLGAMQSRKHRLTLSVLDDLPRLSVTALSTVLIVELVLRHQVALSGATALAALVLVAVVIGRGLAYRLTRALRGKESFQRRTILIGSGKVANELVRAMQTSPELGLRPRALLDDSPMLAAATGAIPVEPLANQLRSYIAIHQIDTVVIAFSAMRESALLSLLRECDRMDCEILVVPRLFEFVSVTGDMDRIHAIPLVRIRRDAHRSLGWAVKRFASRILAATAMVLLSPLLLAIACAVRMEDRSTAVLFRQTRITGDGREFQCLKFRSMKPASSEESDTTWNISQDSRISWLGRFLRKSSLDELPQLWNVMCGDMDLVGPRPERPHFVDKFASEIPGYSARHRVPGGLTGWAAVHGFRGDTSLEDRALYDNFYIENWSLWLDVKIILRTVVSVLGRTGG